MMQGKRSNAAKSILHSSHSRNIEAAVSTFHARVHPVEEGVRDWGVAVVGSGGSPALAPVAHHLRQSKADSADAGSVAAC